MNDFMPLGMQLQIAGNCICKVPAFGKCGIINVPAIEKSVCFAWGQRLSNPVAIGYNPVRYSGSPIAIEGYLPTAYPFGV